MLSNFSVCECAVCSSQGWEFDHRFFDQIAQGQSFKNIDESFIVALTVQKYAGLGIRSSLFLKLCRARKSFYYSKNTETLQMTFLVEKPCIPSFLHQRTITKKKLWDFGFCVPEQSTTCTVQCTT